MRDWPPIDDPEVLAWVGLDHDAWVAELLRRVVGFGRPFTEEAYAHALLYPWERPEGSYVLRDGEATQLAALPADGRAGTVASLMAGRHPLVAFGANGAPSRLVARFAGFPEPADRDALVLTGDLLDVDVGAQASPSVFGTVPGALIASPGTAVRAATLWLTTRQLATIVHHELGYRFGRLDRARFVADDGVEVEQLFAFVSRTGGLRLDGEPVALAAVPASGRTVPAMTQEELLGAIGRLVFGPDATAREVARRCLEDTPALFRAVAAVTWPTAVRLPDDHWTPYPVG